MRQHEVQDNDLCSGEGRNGPKDDWDSQETQPSDDDLPFINVILMASQIHDCRNAGAVPHTKAVGI